VSALQEDSLVKFRHWMRQERGYDRRTESTYLAGAVRYLEWLDARSLLPATLTSARMKLVLKQSRGRRRVGYKTQPIKEAVPLIIRHYDGMVLPEPRTPKARRDRLCILRNRAVVHTLFATGLRAQEIASLKRSDCDDGQANRVQVTGKGEKERMVMLNEEAQAAIQAYLAARDEDRAGRGSSSAGAGKGEPLFVRHDRPKAAKPITTKTVWLLVHEAARKLELKTGISPHDFRRYIATTLLSEGMPLESVQEFLGHESIVTTRTVYARTWNEVLTDQVATYRPTPSDAMRRAVKSGKKNEEQSK
jgi:site-specific recombinase XerD